MVGLVWTDRDLTVAALAIIFSLFLAPNYSSVVGLFYMGMALAYGFAVVSKLPEASLFKGAVPDVLGYAIGIAAAGLFWMVGSSFIITGQPFVMETVLRSYAVQSAPILAGLQEINPLVYGLHIPIVETLGFFGFILPFVAMSVFGVPLKWQPNNPYMWLVIALIATSFALFHLTAHRPDVSLPLSMQVQQFDQALVVDWLFGFVSGILVFRYAVMLPALALHVIVNLSVLGLG